MKFLLPSPDERQHLGRFYASTFLMEATHLAMPFQVLLIVTYLGSAKFAIVLFIEQLISVVMEVPTGAWADRFGRKRCVLLGHLVGACGWLAIVPATLVVSDYRLAAMSGAFGLIGAGGALISGAKESWAIDNLKSVGRRHLGLQFFTREHSFAAAGGIFADVVAIIILKGVIQIDLRFFFIATGLGELLTLLVLWTVPEHPLLDEPLAGESTDDEEDVEEDELDEESVSIRETVVFGFASIFNRRTPGLLAFTLLVTWVAATLSVCPETLQAALADFGFEELGFGYLELAVDVFGIFIPLAAIWLADRWHGRWLLALGVALAAVAAALAALHPSVPSIVAIYLMIVSWTGFFHAVAGDYQHHLLSSANRATSSSAINLLTTLAELGATAMLAVMLDAAHLSPVEVVTILGLAALPAILFLMPRFGVPQSLPENNV
jgi:MFS family permease